MSIPPIKGGQGRSARELTNMLRDCGWLALAVVEVAAVIGGICIIDVAAGHAAAGIAVLCCVLVGANCWGMGKETR